MSERLTSISEQRSRTASAPVACPYVSQLLIGLPHSQPAFHIDEFYRGPLIVIVTNGSVSSGTGVAPSQDVVLKFRRACEREADLDFRTAFEDGIRAGGLPVCGPLVDRRAFRIVSQKLYGGLAPSRVVRENNYFTEMCSGSETGSYLRLIYFVYHSTLGLRVIKKK